MQPYHYLVIVCIIIITYNYLAWVKLEWCIFKMSSKFYFSRLTEEYCVFNELRHNPYFIGSWFASGFYLHSPGICCSLVLVTNLNLLTLKIHKITYRLHVILNMGRIQGELFGPTNQMPAPFERGKLFWDVPAPRCVCVRLLGNKVQRMDAANTVRAFPTGTNLPNILAGQKITSHAIILWLFTWILDFGRLILFVFIRIS